MASLVVCAPVWCAGWRRWSCVRPFGASAPGRPGAVAPRGRGRGRGAGAALWRALRGVGAVVRAPHPVGACRREYKNWLFKGVNWSRFAYFRRDSFGEGSKGGKSGAGCGAVVRAAGATGIARGSESVLTRLVLVHPFGASAPGRPGAGCSVGARLRRLGGCVRPFGASAPGRPTRRVRVAPWGRGCADWEGVCARLVRVHPVGRARLLRGGAVAVAGAAQSRWLEPRSRGGWSRAVAVAGAAQSRWLEPRGRTDWSRALAAAGAVRSAAPANAAERGGTARASSRSRRRVRAPRAAGSAGRASSRGPS